MLVLGLLAGFGAGFVVGQRLTPPAPPRAVEVPRPEPIELGSGTGGRGSAPSSPLPVPVGPVPTSEVTPEPPATVLEAPPEPQPVPEARAVNPERPIPDPGSPILAPGSPAPDPRPPVPAAGPATIRFDSRPPGATIYLDEVRIGVTPLTMNKVTPGTHQVRMEMLGHDTWRTSVTVKEGEQVFVGGSLE